MMNVFTYSVFCEQLFTMTAICLPFNISAALMVLSMRNRNICPKILDNFPFSILFPKSLGAAILLALSYDLVLLIAHN